MAAIFLSLQVVLMAAEYKLINGDIIKGVPSSINDDGLVVRLDVGGWSERINWGQFTQETLKELANDPKAKPFVEPFIEVPIEVKERERKKKQEIVLKEVPRVERPAQKKSFFASLMNPVGLFLLGVIYLANLYAAAEIAKGKGKSKALLVGLAAIFPIAAPALFMLIPGEPIAVPEFAPEPDPGASAPASPLASAPAAAAGGGLGLAAHAKPGGKEGQAQIWKRGETNFDRKFFESKLAGFFRMVLSEPEKNQVIVIKAAKNEYLAKRISRISSSDIHLQLLRGGAESAVSFSDINEVQVKSKDAV
ncbi:MAG: hypothetical protein SFY81_15680 [Verrucomicrobiota bacterium]|nr:hypothetical protein [Verrucomicrobiota bacterium]